jgi:hypothetical protein
MTNCLLLLVLPMRIHSKKWLTIFAARVLNPAESHFFIAAAGDSAGSSAKKPRDPAVFIGPRAKSAGSRAFSLC